MDVTNEENKNTLMNNENNIKKQVKSILGKLKRGTAYFYDVPEELRLNPKIVKAEREIGIRRTIQKGYDVLENCFFVEENVRFKNYWEEIVDEIIVTRFYNLQTYFDFLQGDIYSNACYYKYYFSHDDIAKYSLDINRINFVSFIDYNIDNCNLNFSKEELVRYDELENEKLSLVDLIKKINSCDNYNDFISIINNLDKTELAKDYLKILIFSFIFNDKDKAFDIVMQYINNNYSWGLEYDLCILYEPQKVLDAYNSSYYALRTSKRHRSDLKHFIEDLKNKKLHFYSHSCFDENTHLYCYYYEGYYDISKAFAPTVEWRKYFDTFEEFALFKKFNLTYCDLSKAIIPNMDLSKYIIDEHTKLPIQYRKNFTYNLSKYYDRKEKHFVINQDWLDEQGHSIKSYNHNFKYFFDFVHFLKGDLSGANLLFCDGLQNIMDFSDLNLNDTRLRSNVLDKIGVNYETATYEEIECPAIVQSNEIESITALTTERASLNDEQGQKIFYISDLHLIHRLKNIGYKSIDDVIYIIQNIIDSLLNRVYSWKGIILIGGDTSSDFSLFKLFVELLRKTLDETRVKLQIVFTLGNHELWDFVGFQFNEIVEKYKKVLTDNKMFLLQNNILLKDDCNNIEDISTSELLNLSKAELLNRVKCVRLILFGGLGFAGRNTEFNANQFIYRQTINRQQEIAESRTFDELYKNVCEKLSNKRVIIFTHMPKKDWCSDDTQIKGFVYVSGHNHINYFYDDGDYRIYSDNQIGYKQVNCHLKFFYLEDDYDTFADYKDGIFEITREEYYSFYRGKNIIMEFNRNFEKLYMLKKNGYYMFILQSANGNLNILNGGAIKGLALKDVKYYFENMDKIISYVKTPLDNFSSYQKQIADEIKAIGGSGNIHGAIIDIDFFNHIYVNPSDLKITAYWASDIINKVIYADTPTLLQNNCPNLYLNYLKQLKNKSDTAIVALKGSSIVKAQQFYLDTDIYRASGEIKKMQRLSSKILSIWIEPETKKLNSNND